MVQEARKRECLSLLLSLCGENTESTKPLAYHAVQIKTETSAVIVVLIKDDDDDRDNRQATRVCENGTCSHATPSWGQGALQKTWTQVGSCARGDEEFRMTHPRSR